MPFQTLEQGITAVQKGYLEEGARLLRIALKSDQIQGVLRATGYLWLAEAIPDPQAKLECYNNALAADPNNAQAQQRIARLMGAGLPPVSPSQEVAPVQGPPFGAPLTASSMGVNPDVPYRTAGILDGPNGPGTAFFVTTDGILATTRYVVGAAEEVRCEVEPGRVFAGRVARAFPLLDLALIATGVATSALPPISSASHIPANTPLAALAHSGRQLAGARRSTKSRIPPDWFPTTFERLADAGGSPVYNNHDQLVGMLTRNTSRTSAYVFGLHIGAIYRALERYRQEMGAGYALTYCPCCGNLSRAGAAGGYYCETCGATLPGAVGIERYPQPRLAAYYGEASGHPCPNPKCRARAGYYENKCLRCGTAISR